MATSHHLFKRLPLVLALGSTLAFTGCAIIIAPDGNDARFESAWSSNAIKGNNEIITEKRAVSGLAGLNVSGPLQVEVKVGGAAGMEVIADSNLVGLVQTQTVGGSQKIWIDERFNSQNPIRVIYTVPQLNEVASSGSGRLTINGLNGSHFNISNNGSRSVVLEGQVARLDVNSVGSGRINALGLLSNDAKVRVHGSGSLNLGAVNGAQLDVTVHGSGSVSATGNVRNLYAQTHGSGSAELSAVKSQTADLNSYGSGDIAAAVSQNVNAQASGSGRVTVYGNPTQRNVSGKRVSFIF
jgi:hypothetical protein